MRRSALIVIWVAATALTTVVAWQIVAAAGEQVSPGPRTPVAAAPGSSTTSDPPTTSSSSTSSTTSTTTPTTTTTTGGGQGPTTSATSPQAWSVKTVPTSGGTVVVSYRPGEVALDAATPKPGFSVEVDDAGPPEVEVEFESEEARVRVKARWDGQLVLEVDEDD